MVDCLIIGDSIAKGIADIRKDCTAYVQSGINSRDWNRKFLNRRLDGKIVVISLGSNDYKGIRSRDELEHVRAAVQSADRVLWILPAIHDNIKEIIYMIADNYGDDIVELRELSPDGVHPTARGYKAIGKLF
jgi:lysophospholipase L1-like esterase